MWNASGIALMRLSDEFKAANGQIPWRQINLMRNIVAHRYGTVDNTITWEVVEKDIPDLKNFCSSLLAAHKDE